MKPFLLLALSSILFVAAQGQTPATPTAATTAAAPESAPTEPPLQPLETKTTHFIFSLLPKSLQKNPVLDYSVISEVTEAGKKLPPATPDNPAYFIAFSAGFRQIGDTYYNEKTLTPDSVEKLLQKSLATNGYLPADAAHPPSLLIIYSWGSHNRETDTRSPTEIEGNLLDSAALVGGDRFAQKMQQMMQMTDEMAGPPDLVAFANPLNLYRDSSLKHSFMLDQARGDLYFVVASAYDYRSAAANTRILLWRSRMTVSSTGVSQPQTLPALIASAGPYFGKDMDEPQVFIQRHQGHVEIGPLRVMDVNDPSRTGEAGDVHPAASSLNGELAPPPPPSLQSAAQATRPPP